MSGHIGARTDAIGRCWPSALLYAIYSPHLPAVKEAVIAPTKAGPFQAKGHAFRPISGTRGCISVLTFHGIGVIGREVDPGIRNAITWVRASRSTGREEGTISQWPPLDNVDPQENFNA